MGKPKTYRRPMAGWWLRNPFYKVYMIREFSSILVTLYALILLVGLYRLSQGQAAFDAWRAALATPGAILFYCVTLAAFFYHAWTWFEIMPKTMPFIRVGGKRIPDNAIVAGGASAAVVLSIVLFALAWWVTR